MSGSLIYQTKIKELPKFLRPREKLAKSGPEALNNSELLALLLGKGLPGKSALQLAKDTLSKYSDRNLPKLTFKELVSEKGIGAAAAGRILAGFELSKRLLLDQQNDNARAISSPKTVFEMSKEMRNYKKEHFVCLCLNARNQLIHQETVSIGTLNTNSVHPREVFEPAIKNFTTQVILTHNHPSGDPEPSEDDLEITKRLVEAGRILGIEVIDHIVVAKTSYFSFKEKGKL